MIEQPAARRPDPALIRFSLFDKTQARSNNEGFVNEGKLVNEVSKTLNIPGTRIWTFLKRYETSNRIEADQRGGRRYTKFTLEIENQIRQLVANNYNTMIQGILDTLE
ncbi:hypothetical protein RF11_01605 [Thelohanellus kitauei]|uniref:Uncharacterized protein n=1 Tax=Thelohanellus kitauei TaxID=669202 RepID=A0A0C2N8C4_THEKT|nr:hypothetical protein RF11_01605 [Thelohanellus kitauei]